jgi:hypothetical protein
MRGRRRSSLRGWAQCCLRVEIERLRVANVDDALAGVGRSLSLLKLGRGVKAVPVILV